MAEDFSGQVSDVINCRCCGTEAKDRSWYEEPDPDEENGAIRREVVLRSY